MPAASLRIAGGFLLLALLALAPSTAGDAEASHGVYEGSARAFSIDLDPFADVENTATSLGPRENCASVYPNGIQDGDEHAVDAITFDATVSDIPADYPMIAFQFTIVYDQDAFTITGDDTNFLLGYNDGSQIFGASGHETEGWMSAALDIGLGQPESGSGVLARIDMDIESDAAPGMYVLSAINIAHVDDLNDTQKPHTFEPAMIVNPQ